LKEKFLKNKLKKIHSNMKKLFYKKPLKLLSLLKEKNLKKLKNNTKFTKKNNIKNKKLSNKIWLKPLSKPKEMTIIPFVLKLPTKTKNKFSLNNVVHLSLLIKFLVPLILDSVSLVALNMLDSTL